MFTPNGERKLREFIAQGRITLTWAKAFCRAKSNFDPNRIAYKERRVFIPVQPSYLISNYDLTLKGILEILGECYVQIESRVSSFDEEECEQQCKRAQRTLTSYDADFKANKCFDPGYEDWINEYPGRQSYVVTVLSNHLAFSNAHPDDAVPPAWMKIHYAWKNRVYMFVEIRAALLETAQKEIRNDPRCLKFESVAMEDALISELFEIEYGVELQRWQRQFDALERQMDEYQSLLCAVQECQYAGAPQ